MDILLERINPLLYSKENFKYRVLVCGGNLPASYDNLENFNEKNIIYTGFVDDISILYKGSDILINTVTDGGGIKTKVVEALGNNLSVISTQSGAIGIPETITGGKMKVIADTDWNGFTEQINLLKTITGIPQEFFDHFYWGNIAAKAVELINKL